MQFHLAIKKKKKKCSSPGNREIQNVIFHQMAHILLHQGLRQDCTCTVKKGISSTGPALLKIETNVFSPVMATLYQYLRILG